MALVPETPRPSRCLEPHPRSQLDGAGDLHRLRTGGAARGLCFILPAAVMVTILAWVYVRFGTMPRIAGVLHGIKPVVIAIVVQALWILALKAIKRSGWLAVLGLVTGTAFARQ